MTEPPDQAALGTAPRIEPLGDGALLITIGDTIDLALNERARRLAAAADRLRSADSRFGRAVPAYASVLVPFDPVAVDPDEARRLVAELVAEAAADRSLLVDDSRRDIVEIPVRYGGSHGPDLDDVAEHNGLRASDVVELHAGTEYRVFFLGFAPGFAYLGTLPERIATPRLATPRERVPAGSVGIAGSQTGVYPFALPGGWRIIGHTDVAMWDLSRDSPSVLHPGDRVRFVPVD